MIQGIRVFLNGGITASVALARRANTMKLFSGGIITDGPSPGSLITDVTTNLAAAVVIKPGPPSSPPDAPPAPYDQNRADWVPFYDDEEGDYVWYTLDQYVLGAVNPFGGSIDYRNWQMAKSCAIEALLDPQAEPIFTTVNGSFTGTDIFPFKNCKSARIQITGTTPDFLRQNIDGSLGYGQYMNVSDSGKVGWVSAGHGEDATPLANLDWDAPQFLYFSNNRIHFNPGG